MHTIRGFTGNSNDARRAELLVHRDLKVLKQTSGMYSEIEWIKSDTANADPVPSDGAEAQAVRMAGSEGQQSVEKLAAAFGNAKAKNPWAQNKTDVLSPLQEDEEHYYATAVIKKDKDRLKQGTITWLKEPLKSWLAKAEIQIPVRMAATTGIEYTFPAVGDLSTTCTQDIWTTTSTTNASSARSIHGAVWTGSEMIVWGREQVCPTVLVFNTGGRYCAQSPTPTPTATFTPTPTATATATPTPTPRATPTPRPRPTPAPRPTP
jgi:hypothetical protein